MFCSNCGTKLGEGINFCSNCGKAVNDKPITETASTVSAALTASTDKIRYRHGFTSFWLYGQLVLSIVSFLVFSLISTEWFARYFNLSGSDVGILRISMTVYFIAEILMINWRRLGFYIWATVPIAFIFLDPLGQGFVLNLFSAGISIGIFYAILRLRNKHNGKSTWEQMGDRDVSIAMAEHKNEIAGRS